MIYFYLTNSFLIRWVNIDPYKINYENLVETKKINLKLNNLCLKHLRDSRNTANFLAGGHLAGQRNVHNF
ncbi:hypothetical protein BpHYR1_017028 [Brachionus plicatilis]|uniref:Uncharacterized protein n=1 Tax=Brachionus plicatilis TaxID=10195 RepID=A0A3M7RQI6_BRAPC|nr:hypothetical protein BpHYR1_017028 [Brachionus plicatilis]